VSKAIFDSSCTVPGRWSRADFARTGLTCVRAEKQEVLTMAYRFWCGDSATPMDAAVARSVVECIVEHRRFRHGAKPSPDPPSSLTHAEAEDLGFDCPPSATISTQDAVKQMFREIETLHPPASGRSSPVQPGHVGLPGFMFWINLHP
jgi:hypothetical protein